MTDISHLDPVLLGKRLLLARKRRGLTQDEVATQLGLSRPTLIAIEKGVRLPRPEELVRFGEIYKRPIHELLRPDAPAIELHPHLRAVVTGSGVEEVELDAAINELERFASDYRTLESLLGAPLTSSYPPEITLPPRLPAEEWAEDIATRERARLGLGDQPVRNLRDLLESEVGLRILYWPLPSAIAGLYAFVADSGPCVLVNLKHPAERRRATTVHEYGHFLLHRQRPGVDYSDAGTRKPASERFVEAFGMAFLMPSGGVRRQFMEIVRSTNDFQVADLCRLANVYYVSLQAITLRLEQLRLVPAGTYEDLVDRGFRPNAAREMLALQQAQPDADDVCPRGYTLRAVRCYEDELISEGQLARFLRTDRLGARRIVEQMRPQLPLDSQAPGSLSGDQSLLRKQD